MSSPQKLYVVFLQKWTTLKQLHTQFLDRKKKKYFYLKDLSINIQHIDCDLYVPGYALPALLKFALLQCDVKVIPHLSCRNRKVQEATRH